jgi:hypothetical protein
MNENKKISYHLHNNIKFQIDRYLRKNSYCFAQMYTHTLYAFIVTENYVDPLHLSMPMKFSQTIQMASQHLSTQSAKYFHEELLCILFICIGL